MPAPSCSEVNYSRLPPPTVTPNTKELVIGMILLLLPHAVFQIISDARPNMDGSECFVAQKKDLSELFKRSRLLC